ncbi:MAG TPA: hypothetical protein VLT59_04475, partial [Steroidobacteraceae bacterium]|nr:hypothetical protein [Steroidobacteraceae bacterium]
LSPVSVDEKKLVFFLLDQLIERRYLLLINGVARCRLLRRAFPAPFLYDEFFSTQPTTRHAPLPFFPPRLMDKRGSAPRARCSWPDAGCPPTRTAGLN